MFRGMVILKCRKAKINTISIYYNIQSFENSEESIPQNEKYQQQFVFQ